MEIIAFHYIFYLLPFFALVLFILVIPPIIRNRYDKYDRCDRIQDISNKHDIIKPKCLMFNLDHQHEGNWYYRWISLWSEKMPRYKDASIVLLKKSTTSIQNEEEKKIYTEWLINELSERAKKKSDSRDYYIGIKESMIKTYDNLNHSDFNTEEKINDVIENLVKGSNENNSSDYDINTRRAYFKTFIDKPHLKRSDLVKLVCDKNTIVDRDIERLLRKEDPPSVLTTWETSLRNDLKDAGLKSLARKLER